MRALVTVGLLLSLAAETVSAADHLASSSAVQERLAGAALDREQRIAAIDALLDTPQAARLGEASGIDIPQLERQVALLSDADLRELALRAEALKSDPVAGSGSGDWAAATLIAIPLAVLLVSIVLRALSGLG